MAWVRCCGGGEPKFNGAIIPSSKVRFSPMYTASGVTINCSENFITKSGSGWGNVGTTEAYDFTDYSTLTITGEITNYAGNDLCVGYGTSRYSGFDIYNHMTHVDYTGNGTFTATLNITGQNGYRFILIGGGNMNYRIDTVVLS